MNHTKCQRKQAFVVCIPSGEAVRATPTGTNPESIMSLKEQLSRRPRAGENKAQIVARQSEQLLEYFTQD